MIDMNEVMDFKETIHKIKLNFEEADEDSRSRTLNDLEELSAAFFVRKIFFPKVQDLTAFVKSGELVPVIPNHKLHDMFTIVPKKRQQQNLRFMYAYVAIALIASVSTFFVDNYWLLTSLPIAFVSFSFFSGHVNRSYLFLALIGTILCIIFEKHILGALLGIHVISIYCGECLRLHRRNVLLDFAFKDDEIFWFLYSTGVLSIYDGRIGRIIYKGCQMPTLEEYQEVKSRGFNQQFANILNKKH